MAKRITTLTVTDWRYLAIAIFELARARIAYACEPAGKIVSRLKDASAGTAETPAPAQMAVDIARLAWAIGSAARRVPWRSDCLLQVMAADRWLRRHGIAATFHLGVAKDPDGSLRAHAWLRHGSGVVAGGSDAGFLPLIEPAESNRTKLRH